MNKVKVKTSGVVKSYFKRKWKLLLALTIFWILLISIVNPFLDKPVGERKYGYVANATIVLNKGDELKQDFLMPFDGLNAIVLNFQDINTDINQQILFQIWDAKENRQIINKRITLSEIEENGEYKISFSTINDSANRNYYFKLTNVSENDNEPIVLYAHVNKANFEKEAFLNDTKNDANLNFKAVFCDNNVNIIYLITSIALLLLSYLCVLLLKGRFKHDFFIIATLLGMGFLLLNPFPQPLDESTHFFRSFCISQGNWHDSINENGDVGAEVPEIYGDVLATEFSPLSWYANRELFNQTFDGDYTFYVNPYMSSVIPIDHAVAVLGIAIGRILQLPIAIVIYLSRFMDLLFYLCFGYWALRLTKYYTSIFFGILLLPTCLFLAGSCTQDAVLISASLCFIAGCLNLILNDEVETIKLSDIVPLLITIPFIASIKYLIYVPIFLLILFIPSRKFGRYRKLLLGVVIAGISLLLLFYQIYLLKEIPFIEDRNGYVDVGKQIKFVFENLYFTYRNFGTYFFENIFKHIQNAFVEELNGLSSFTGIWVILGSILAQDKYIWKDKKKNMIFVLSISLISLIIFGLTMAALYAGFTPVGEWGIDGLQTRYIFPFLPLVGIALANLPIKNYMKNYENKYAFIMIIANTMAIMSRCL